MSRRQQQQPEPPYALRILSTIERVDGAGYHQPGEVVPLDTFSPASVAILLERGLLMPHYAAEQIAALPELA